MAERMDLPGNPFAADADSINVGDDAYTQAQATLALAWEVRQLRAEVRAIVVGSGFDE